MTTFLVLGWILVAASVVGMFRLRLPLRGFEVLDCSVRALGLIGGASLLPALCALVIGLASHRDGQAWAALAFLPLVWFLILGGGTALLVTIVSGVDYAHDNGWVAWMLIAGVQAIVTMLVLAYWFRGASRNSRGIPPIPQGLAMAICANAGFGVLALIPMITND